MKASLKKPMGKPGKASAKPKKNVSRFVEVSEKDASPAPQWLVNGARRLSAAERGDIDPEALDIVRSISHKKHFEKYGEEPRTMLRMYEKGGPMKNTRAILSPDGLVDAERERILKAVRDFDRKFLMSLIKSMDLCDNGSGLARENPYHLASAHLSYYVCHRTYPTVRQLQKYLKVQRGIEMDPKTITFICKRDGLEISADKRGRPKVDS